MGTQMIQTDSDGFVWVMTYNDLIRGWDTHLHPDQVGAYMNFRLNQLQNRHNMDKELNQDRGDNVLRESKADSWDKRLFGSAEPFNDFLNQQDSKVRDKRDSFRSLSNHILRLSQPLMKDDPKDFETLADLLIKVYQKIG